MGIDLKAGGRRKGHNVRKAPVSKNVYVKLLEKLYSFIGRRGESKFAKTIVKRLRMSRINNPPISISRIARYMQGKSNELKDKDGNIVKEAKEKSGMTAVIVGGVTDDPRLVELKFPLSIAATRFTESVRARIVKAGGECLTLDQLATKNPTGKDTVLLRGSKSSRESVKHFGHRTSPGNPHTHDGVKPRLISKGRKFERARGRRKSTGFKV